MVRDYDADAIPSVYNFEDVPPVRENPGMSQRVFRGIDQMVGFTVIEPDKPDAEPHTHPWEQINLLVEGRLDFVVGDERISLGPYDVVEIPPGVPHTSRAVADEPAVLLAFWPLQETHLHGTAYQTEFAD